MTGAYFSAEMQDDDLTDALLHALKKYEDPTTMLLSWGETMLPRISDRFKNESGPSGEKWVPLSSSQKNRRLKKYPSSQISILRMRGHLAGSINYQVVGKSLSFGTGKEVEAYAAIHQFGGEAGRDKKTKIPARPYLGFGDEDLEILEEEAALFLAP